MGAATAPVKCPRAASSGDRGPAGPSGWPPTMSGVSTRPRRGRDGAALPRLCSCGSVNSWMSSCFRRLGHSSLPRPPWSVSFTTPAANSRTTAGTKSAGVSPLGSGQPAWPCWCGASWWTHTGWCWGSHSAALMAASCRSACSGLVTPSRWRMSTSPTTAWGSRPSSTSTSGHWLPCLGPAWWLGIGTLSQMSSLIA